MSTLPSTHFALLALNIVIGIMANGFIVLFICVDWFRSRKLSPTDLILGCLGLSRFLLQTIEILNAVTITFFSCTYLQKYTWMTASTMCFLMNNISLWFAAWLSVLYFVKVAIFSHPVFLQVKQRFPVLVPWLLLGSVVFCAAMTMTVATIFLYVFSICPYYQPLSCNHSDSANQSLNFCTYSAILYNAPSLIPLMLFSVSSIFLISSLWKHLRRMQLNGISVRDLNTQVHLTAIKVLASFAVLYLSSFVADILQSVRPLNYEHPWIATLFENVSALYLSGHAIVLILINPKLKQGWVRMLHHFKYCLSEAPS